MNWIKCSETMPPPFTRVLGCIFDSKTGEPWLSIVAYEGDQTPAWYDEVGPIAGGDPEFWTPLPEPPPRGLEGFLK